MRLESPDGVGRYDALYVTPSATLLAFSAPGRLADEAQRGRRVLVALMPGQERPGEGGQAEEYLTAAGIDILARAPSDAAPVRGPYETRLRDCEALVESARARLLGLRARATPRDVIAPLGLGGSVEHQVVHQAAREVFAGEPGRNLLLFEERPHVFLPGSLWVRLGQLAARLPPGVDVPDRRATLVEHLLRFNAARHLRGELGGLRGRLRATRLTARRWREARTWRPARAFGLRVQPVVQTAPEALLAQALEALHLGVVRMRGSAESLLAAARRYTRRLSPGASYAERLWLVLPERHQDESGR